jgi:hypothetical protein
LLQDADEPVAIDPEKDEGVFEGKLLVAVKVGNRFAVRDSAPGFDDNTGLLPFKELRMSKIHNGAGIVHADPG